jgi:cytochrome o ubiquinol oxidase subunit 2
MKLKLGLIATVAAIIGVTAAVTYYFLTHDISLLQPKGTIAKEQYDLLVFASLLSVIVVIPVFTLLIVFSWKYRASNTKATYTPNWDSNKKAEAVWWGVPIILIIILSVVTWNSTHALDPYKPLTSSTPPINVQVVSLQWKWLFIYPDYGIATVNSLQIPEQTPINFTITSDAPMNSFWIPDLGGQIYAMAGMQTKLHLMADGVDSYRGLSNNISGEGFSDMVFTVDSTSKADFSSWVENTKSGTNILSEQRYNQLAQPSVEQTTTTFSDVQPGLYTTILHKYMNHSDHTTEDMTNDPMHMEHN